MTELTLEESLSMSMAMIAKRLDENTNLIKELQASIDLALRNQKASIKALEIQENDGEKDLEAHYTNAKPLGKALPQKRKTRIEDLISTKLIVELADRTVKRSKEIAKNVLVGIDKFTFPADFIILDIPEDFNTPLILERPFLSTDHAVINVFKEKLTLSVGNDKIFFRSDKPTSNIIKRVYALEYRRNQVKFFVPIIDEGEGVDEPIIEDIETKFHNIGDNEDKCEYLGFYNFCHP
nr:hypothetical protein [Tanacetum cinerariifolium]